MTLKLNPDLADLIAEAIIDAKVNAETMGRKFMRSEIAPIIRAMLPPAKATKPRQTIDERAEQIYALYPRKVAPEAAKRAITAALKKIDFETLAERVGEYANHVNAWSHASRYTKDNRDTVPHPATWFNEGRYNDDPKEWRRPGSYQVHQPTVPTEPAGWREEFPDFTDIHLPWSQLKPDQQSYIIIAMTQKSMTAVVAEDKYSTRLRDA
jgi:hypothetical protein